MTKVFCEMVTEYKAPKDRPKYMNVSTREKRRIESARKGKVVEQKKLNFYAQNGTQIFYLFSQNFTQELYDFFKNGVLLEKCYDFSNANEHKSISRARERIKAIIPKIEQINDVILRKSSKRFESRER